MPPNQNPRPGLTLEEARAQLLSHLDDVDGRRFAPVRSGVQDWTNVDRALRSSVSRCIDDMCAGGMERLLEDIEVTSTDEGVADLTDYDPVEVKGVQLDVDGTFYRIEEGDRLERFTADTEERDLLVTIQRRYELPTDEDELVLGRYLGAARSWPALEDWIVARAALHAAIKDKDKRDGLIVLAADCEKSVMRSPRTPRTLPYPTDNPVRTAMRRLRWFWDPYNRSIRLYVSPRTVL